MNRRFPSESTRRASLVGVPWLMAATGWDFAKAFSLGVQPFLVGDAIKLLLAAGLFPIAWWVVGRGTEER